MLKTIQTPYLKIAYEENDSPSSYPIILVHGFPDDVRTWDSVERELLPASYRKLQMEVEYDETLGDETQIIAAVKQLGYEATPVV
jgi:pimeloyl-ACP methyl ester carboxylesterase